MHKKTPLIFKQSKIGRKGYKVDNGTVKNSSFNKFINKNLLRKKLELPQLTEFQVVRHFTNLSEENSSFHFRILF